MPPIRNRTVAEFPAGVADAVHDEKVDEVKGDVSGNEGGDSKQADAQSG